MGCCSGKDGAVNGALDFLSWFCGSRLDVDVLTPRPSPTKPSSVHSQGGSGGCQLTVGQTGVWMQTGCEETEETAEMGMGRGGV